ncbi:MAG: 50S ribosomal protein L19, large subunit ribosomal protein L19 [candidate division Kazan bacterium GW2011_GWA1_50_15]|uniref:Large ribosomal subunit protein bL19 n=2 Tax=Bacteria division Kazan-3B-28 TaxID=1798534 RepID=A0A0G1ZH49_UNCK3|nr:MAG: 50S ribosomal protein L19, large subunit ribosomal protein L19 [candidate division Kazan bacterium GW2011_GWA1_50_15]KKW25733.1 MAG: 50S ribosomal protein L19 [candidate division Kazan bacterium GW2011_GWC1_52_13]KKW27252.1 MAG: 50S ribosomal protein L19 [candidate division Kazan bacterium GW2011_GWB1_52_7]HAV65978.1 50S ribosomal protein L19 [Patescibacteria group bacterium]HCR42546.1 50S ribosomal protein L19 [Patescibacteria group bacterium]
MANLAEPILNLFRKSSVPQISVGDVVRVHQKIREGDKERVQVFEGIVIAKHAKTSLDATFTVRKIASGVGVERTYLLHSPNIVKIEFKRGSTVRRAKLYYLRNLSGKGLRMKDKQTNKVAWEIVLGGEAEVQTEATEADIAEAVAAEEAKKAIETETEGTTSGTIGEEGGAAPAEDSTQTASKVEDEATNAGGESDTAQPTEAGTEPTDAGDRAGDSGDRA